MKVFKNISFFLFLYFFLFHSLLPHNHSKELPLETQEEKTVLALIFDIFKNTLQHDLGNEHLETLQSKSNTKNSHFLAYFFKEPDVVFHVPIIKIVSLTELSCLVFFPIRKIYLHNFSYRGPTQNYSLS